jgi:hypothetical protein
MTNKELKLLGMSLKALLDVGEVERVREIVNAMASDGINLEADSKKGKKKTNG